MASKPFLWKQEFRTSSKCYFYLIGHWLNVYNLYRRFYQFW